MAHQILNHSYQQLSHRRKLLRPHRCHRRRLLRSSTSLRRRNSCRALILRRQPRSPKLQCNLPLRRPHPVQMPQCRQDLHQLYLQLCSHLPKTRRQRFIHSMLVRCVASACRSPSPILLQVPRHLCCRHCPPRSKLDSKRPALVL